MLCIGTKSLHVLLQRPNTARVGMYTKTWHPLKAQLFPITMLHVKAMHEGLHHAVIMLIMLCYACTYSPIPHISLQPPPKRDASELHTQRRQTCTQERTTTTELSSPISSQAKMFDEKRMKCMLRKARERGATAMLNRCGTTNSLDLS